MGLLAALGTACVTTPEFRALERFRQLGLKHGLILYARRNNFGQFGDWVMITPPLIITKTECHDYLNRLEKTIREFESALRTSGYI